MHVSKQRRNICGHKWHFCGIACTALNLGVIGNTSWRSIIKMHLRCWAHYTALWSVKASAVSVAKFLSRERPSVSFFNNTKHKCEFSNVPPLIWMVSLRACVEYFWPRELSQIIVIVVVLIVEYPCQDSVLFKPELHWCDGLSLKMHTARPSRSLSAFVWNSVWWGLFVCDLVLIHWKWALCQVRARPPLVVIKNKQNKKKKTKSRDINSHELPVVTSHSLKCCNFLDL